MLETDQIISYRWTASKAVGYTRARIFNHAGARIAIVTELDRNPGPSITNAAEHAYAEVRRQFGDDLILIEHYPDSRGDRFSRVIIEPNDVDWKHLAPNDVMQLIGEELSSHTASNEPAYLELAELPVPPTEQERQATALRQARAIADESKWLSRFSPSPTGERIYEGHFDYAGRPAVIVRDAAAVRRLAQARQHGGDFAWGYGGSGPHQTAYSLLADALDLTPLPTGEIPEIERLSQAFKWHVVAAFPKNDDFTITREAVVAWYDKQQKAPRCPTHRIVLDDDGCWECEADAEARDEAAQP